MTGGGEGVRGVLPATGLTALLLAMAGAAAVMVGALARYAVWLALLGWQHAPGLN
jgi:hypothetical protein